MEEEDQGGGGGLREPKAVTECQDGEGGRGEDMMGGVKM